MKKLILILSGCLLLSFSNAQTLLSGMPDPSGSVNTILRVGNTVYMGGAFMMVDSITHSYFASFDANTGVVNPSDPVFDGRVTNITRVGNKLVVAGDFSNVNSQARGRICLLDLNTGSLDMWSGDGIYSWSQGIGVENNFFYYCKKIGPSGAGRIVCIDASTGTATSWQSDSAMQGDVNAILVSGNYVYVGGNYSFDGGNSVYNHLCRFDKTTGALDLSWQPQPPTSNFGITTLFEHNSQVFVGGVYDHIAGQNTKGVASFDANGAMTNFRMTSSAWEVFAVAPLGNNIFVGGNSSSMGGQLRYRIAEISLSNFNATCWNASSVTNTWGYVNCIFVSGDTVYVGPGGSPRLSVFINNPQPILNAGMITGPLTVSPSQVATYSIPFVAGNMYWWSVSGGTGSSSADSINVTWGTGSSGTITVVENNPSAGFNCSSDTVTIQVTISGGSGIDNIHSSSEINISPNPASGIFSIKTKSAIDYFEIYDVTGNIILRKDDKSNDFTIDLTPFSNGIYFLTVNQNGKRMHKKIIKE